MNHTDPGRLFTVIYSFLVNICSLQQPGQVKAMQVLPIVSLPSGMFENSKSNSAKHVNIYLNGNTKKCGYVGVLQAYSQFSILSGPETSTFV